MLQFSFLISLVSILGSLYFSEILGYPPCDLCWYQRILMYPLPLMILIATIYKDVNVKYYLRTFSLIGVVIAMYHCIVQQFSIKTTFCNFTTSDCSIIQTKYIGFITIPSMSLIAFVLIFISSFFIKNDKVSQS
ncbi:disulfide bond formation protein B [Bacillus sp. CDB3]|uniref:disulfide bond formation protein B n=1 Tax=Bacillus sp. CDB3 TaxID=360310 RepID=UPI0009D8428D|nr:disulfide bond formation protein B [Bacillus sp. CDB3]OQR53363.1 disulfide bond formation protein B [Bacillus sp. CDB3]